MAPRAGGGGSKAKRERRRSGACSAGPGQVRGSGHSWRCSASASPARRQPGPPGGQAGWADCCARGRSLKQPALNQMWASSNSAYPRLSDLRGSSGVIWRPYPSTCQAQGLQPETDWGADSPLPGPLLTGKRGHTGGPSAPRAGPSAERGLGARVDARWAADKKRQLSESEVPLIEERQDLREAGAEQGTPGGSATSQVEALRLSPPPDGNPPAEARGTGLDWGGQPEATLGQG